MHFPKQTLLGLLQGDTSDFESDEGAPSYINSTNIAHLYVDAAMFVTSMEYLTEQLWLQDRDDRESGIKTTYRDFIVPFLGKELLSARSFKDFLLANGPTHLKDMRTEAASISSDVLSAMMERSGDEQKIFLLHSLKEMSSHFLYEETLQDGRLQSLGHLGPCLYRSFDALDELFDLNYQLDREMVQEPLPKERLYQGSGSSVQSGYSTILLALHHLDLQAGDKVVDLGSGYGRVGLVCSLLHPEVDFVGYEYVLHRVDVSNRASRSLGLEEGLHFHTQDLSSQSFKLPNADVYYLYDPFTDETYQYILEQIVEVSENQKVTIVTKGNARSWLIELARTHGWLEPLFFDEGNLSLFRSA